MIVFLLAIVATLAVAAPAGAHELADGCRTSGPVGASYQVTVCIDNPVDGASLTGTVAVNAHVTVTGCDSCVRRLEFNLDGAYLLTDFRPDYTFNLATERYANGPHDITVQARMRDDFLTEPAGADVTFENGPDAPTVNTRTYTPKTGTIPPAGQPLVVAHAGDGASGEPDSMAVKSRISSWAPNLFLYSGDVYDKGTIAEFGNWGAQYFDSLRDITNPVVGNHEYEDGVAPGYFDFWDNIPHYYSYDAQGWHFVALDSTYQFGESAPGSPQYEWLRQDLQDNVSACTIVYMHHPVWNIGQEGEADRYKDFWRLFANNGVDLLLTGHDHSYQRWQALDANGNPSPTGTTEIIVGTGGHGTQDFVREDGRVEKAITDFVGAQRLELNPQGAAYRFETAGGVTLDSGSVQCNGTPPDITAPTAPANLTAAPQRLTEVVDLAWEPATDNVGIVGYDIYRNGQLLTRIGPKTQYKDTSVAAGSSYTYSVRARDEAGNEAPASNEATAQTDDLAVAFYSGFETGDVSRWDTYANLTVQDQDVFSGRWAARAQSPAPGTTANRPNWANRAVTPNTELYAQTRFKVLSQGTQNVNLLAFRTAAGTRLLTVYRNSAGKLVVKREVAPTGNTQSSTTVATSGAWHTLQARLLVNGASGTSTVWLDGVVQPQLTTTADYGTAPIGEVEIGDRTSSGTGKSYDIVFDEVAVDPNFVADRTSPQMTDRLSATATSGLEVRLDWDAATDDVGVTGYEIYRDGALLTTTGAQTSYRDNTVDPDSSYYYEVRARDAAGNHSQLTDIATVDTPAIFDDDFETGDTSRWTVVDGLAVTGAERYSGSFGARATGAGTKAYAYFGLPSQQNELYLRARIKRISQVSSSLNLLRFRDSSGKSLLALGLNSQGRLTLRNDTPTSPTTKFSGAGLADGGWHEVQVHLRRSPGIAEVWLDGTPLNELSGADDFGSGLIGRFELGESSLNRTFDVAYDDVRLDATAIPDTTVPMPATNLTATAISANRVDLSWTPATDNVGVTGYDIYRNGRLHVHINPASSYQDTTVAPNTTYTYELRASDAAENESVASNSASATTPVLDSSPPSAPSGLSADPRSPTSVELSWTGSTDNIGVAGYEIYRNGDLVGMTTTATTYSDTSIAAATNVTYTIKARDAAGNASGASNAASARVSLFADGFEQGTGRWTNVTNIAVGTAEVFSGSQAVRATSTGSPTYAYGTLGRTSPDVVADVRFKVLSAGTDVYLMKLRTAAAGSLLGIYRKKSNNTLVMRNDVTATNVASTTAVSLGEWHRLQLRAHVEGAVGATEVWLDGTRVSALSLTQDLGAVDVGRIQIGDNTSSGRSYDVAFDDVDVDLPTSVTVETQTNPDGASQAFDFTGDGPLGAFSLGDGGRRSVAVVPGTYQVTQGADPSGWDLTGIECSDENDGEGASTTSGRTATMRASAGENVQCTFTSTQRGQVVVEQQTDPADTGDPKERFSFTGLPGPDPIELEDGQQSTPVSVAPGAYTVTQSEHAGYDLIAITCDDPDATVALPDRKAILAVAPGETVHCAFTNAKHAELTLAQETDPDATPGSFTFHSTDVSQLDAVTLADGGRTSASVSAGRYAVTQDAAPGWLLSALLCTDPAGAPANGSETDLAARRATFDVAAGEHVICTFTNALESPG